MYVAIAIILVLVLALLGVGMRIVWSVELENRMTEAEIESSRRYQAMLGDRVERVRRYRHDADALLRAIERATDFGAERFPLSHSAIELQRHRCEQAGIPLIVEFEDISQALIACGMDDSDLCLILQNLLDNAFEASMAIDKGVLPAEERAIVLRLAGEEVGGVIVEVRNHTAGDAAPTFLTSKENPAFHGVGVQVVADIVRKHGGELVSSFDSETRILTMTVLSSPEPRCPCSRPGDVVQ